MLVGKDKKRGVALHKSEDVIEEQKKQKRRKQKRTSINISMDKDGCPFLLFLLCSLLDNPLGGPDLISHTSAKAPGFRFLVIRSQYLNFWRNEFTDGFRTKACFKKIVSSQQIFGRYFGCQPNRQVQIKKRIF